jgi:hypothetical protein
MKITLNKEQNALVKKITPQINKAGRILRKGQLDLMKAFNKELVKHVKTLVATGLTIKQARKVVEKIALPYMSQQNYSELMNKSGLRTTQNKRSDSGEKKGITKEQILKLWGDASAEVQADTFEALKLRMA